MTLVFCREVKSFLLSRQTKDPFKIANEMKSSFCVDSLNMNGLYYKWKNDKVIVEKKSIAQFDINKVELSSRNVSYISG